MKVLNVVIFASILALAASAVHGSEIVREVIKLQRAGIDREVILHYVKNTNRETEMSADDIQRLDDEGVSATVIVAMLDRGRDLRDENADDGVTSYVEPTATEVAVRPETTVTGDYQAELYTPRPHEEVFVPRQESTDISLFYEALSPHGTWRRDSSYGWVWEPHVAIRESNWRPYANDGNWVWTNHGWYWESNYSYGWAVYHYGRWHNNAQNRWVWVPDNVWGPAWVNWRQSESYLGWAPLPPEARYENNVGFSFRNKRVAVDFNFGLRDRDYNFVQSDRFLHRNVGRELVPPTRVTNVYNETTIINNTYVYNDNRIINNGVSRDVVARHTKQKIEQVEVVDAGLAVGAPIRGERRKDNRIMAFRPRVSDKASAEPPAIVARQTAKAKDAGFKVAEPKAISATTAAAPTQREVKKDAAEAEREARQRVQQEKVTRRQEVKTDKKEATQERKVASDAEQDAKEKARNEAAAARKAATDAEQAGNAKAREEKQRLQQAEVQQRKAAADAEQATSAKARDEAVAARKAATDAEQAGNAKAREEKQRLQQAEVQQRKAAAEAEQATNAKAREEAAAARRTAADAEQAAKAKGREEKQKQQAEQRAVQNPPAAQGQTPAAERKEANQEKRAAAEAERAVKEKTRDDAVAARKTAAEAEKEQREKARDEKREDLKEKREEKAKGK